jgi:hypothetical protein
MTVRNSTHAPHPHTHATVLLPPYNLVRRRVMASMVAALALKSDILPAGVDMDFVESRGGLHLQFMKATFHILANPGVRHCAGACHKGHVHARVACRLAPPTSMRCTRRFCFRPDLRRQQPLLPDMWSRLRCCRCWRGAATATCSVGTT